MADYSEISDIIVDMKKKAIDAFMDEQGWCVDYEYKDRYALWGFIPSWYRRPDQATGEGGGERVGPGWDSLVDSFNNTRGRIDSATKKWVGLPDGSGASQARAAANSVAVQLGAAASGASAIADGEIARSVDTINLITSTMMQGAFTSPFLEKYDAQFSIVLNSTGAAAAILETAYAAEVEISPAARRDAVDICANARNAFAQKLKESAVTGPYAQIVAFHDRLVSTLSSTTAEYDRGIDLFQAVIDDHFGADADATTVAQALDAEMQQEGSPS